MDDLNSLSKDDLIQYILKIVSKARTLESEVIRIKKMVGSGTSSSTANILDNGKIVTSVAGSDLTVAIKTLAGADPSVSSPVSLRIDNNIRVLTSALSITMNDATNWLNLGAVETAGFEVDLFVYLIWNTTLGTPGFSIGVSRKPYAVQVDDLDGSGTSDNGVVLNAGAATSDKMVNIGRFNAKLSAGAAYTWSAPSTSIIINNPIFETRILDSAPVLTAQAPMGMTSYTVNKGKYQIVGRRMFYNFHIGFTPNGSTSDSLFCTLPLTFIFSTSYDYNGSFMLGDGTTKLGMAFFNAGDGRQLFLRRYDSSGFVIGTSVIYGLSGSYPI